MTHLTFFEAVDAAYARADEDDRAQSLMPVEPFDPDAYDRYIPESDVMPDCVHMMATWDAFDGVYRCDECDEPM